MEANLTQEQISAVRCMDNYILLIAGPGTGKTTVLTRRIIHLINDLGVKENDIHAFTFTNKATNEMKSRIAKELKREHDIGISNFHSYAFAHLKDYGYEDIKVVTDNEKVRIIGNLIKERSFIDFDPEDVAKEISRIKNKMLMNETMLFRKLKIIEIYYAYQEYLSDNNYVDFDSMTLDFLNMLKNNQMIREMVQEEYKYVLVDEAQDINMIQYEILKIITEKNHHLFMVGDP